MKKLITIIILSGLILGCSGKKKEAPLQGKQEPLLQNSVEVYFSDANSKDTFIISILGNTILKGEMLFQIINAKGEVLLNERHPSDHLFSYGVDLDNTIADQEKYIKKRVVEFFKDDYFFNRAIQPNEKYDSDYSNEKIWSDIKSDSTAKGFYYLLGLENGCKISYSKKEKKIVTYHCCC